MNLDDIDNLGQHLYQDPELAIPMRDALEDMGVSWGEYLERHGIVTRLAECMVLALNGADIDRRSHAAWRTEIGAPQEYRYPPVGMARAFSVPAIAVYSGEVMHFPNEIPGQPFISWRPPNLSLALAVLRLAIDQQKLLVEPMQGAQVLEVLWAAEAMVRSHYPLANAYRLRLAEGDWGERIYQR